MRNPHKKSHFHLVYHMLELGHSIVVCDDEESHPSSTSFNEIKQAMESTDESWLTINDSNGNKLGSAFIVNGLDDDELVADCSVNDLLNQWDRAYRSDSENQGL